jgi:hypothetical protein
MPQLGALRPAPPTHDPERDLRQRDVSLHVIVGLKTHSLPERDRGERIRTKTALQLAPQYARIAKLRRRGTVHKMGLYPIGITMLRGNHVLIF